MIKAPPPFSTACTGNLRKFPKPTAFPAIAKIKPTREPQPAESEFDIVLLVLDWKDSIF
jgi:hypothetical protein